MNYFIQFLIVFDLICFGVYFGGDIVCTALAKVRKKTDEEEFEIYKVEDDTDTSKPALSIDAIRHLFRGEVHDFVCNKLLPSGQETLSALTEPEQTAARFLFCALIGYLKEEAPMDEQSFPMVMEMLNYAEGAKEDGDKDVIDILMEETAARTHLREEYFSDYRRYQLMQVDKTRVLLACRVIINDLLGKLYRYDYNVGYDCLEDQLLKTFPEEIEKNKGFIAGLEADMATLAAHPHPEDGFAGMEVRGDTLTDKENAGAALLDACKEVKGADPVPVGSYRGFTMSVSFDAFRQEYMLLLKGQMTHRATLGTDPRGNLTRIDNALSQMPQRLEAVKNQLDNLYQQQAAAKAEVGKPFPQEQELRDKSARLAELDVLLNMDGRGRPAPEAVLAKSSRPSVLEGLKRPVPPRCPEKKPKHHEQEVR